MQEAQFLNFSYKFFTGNAATKFFKQCGYDVEDVYQPPKFDVEKGLLKNQLKWLWKYYKYYKNCKEISKEIILKNKPKIIISGGIAKIVCNTSRISRKNQSWVNN